MTTSCKILIGIYLTLVAGSFQPARAVIVFEDPGRLTTMPLVNGTKPGWQFIGTYGSFTGIPIGPRSWVTAEHITGHSIGSAGVLNYDNAGNSASANYSSTLAAISGDLAVMTLDSNQPSFTSWAPVWSDPNTLSKGTSVYIYGRGTERGAATTGGWLWGNGASSLSYGTNQVDGFAADSQNNVYVAMTFNQPNSTNQLPNTEGILSSGDSGGGVFAFNPADGKYELIAVNYGVDVVSLTSNGPLYYASLYDANGYYDNNQQLSSPSAIPLSSYSTSLPNKYDVLAPYIAVPEPGTWVMALIASAGFLLFGKRAI